MYPTSLDKSAAERLGALSLGLASTQGNSRKENMDVAEWFAHERGPAVCLGVADGMGGPAGGREASRIVLAEVGLAFSTWEDDDWEACLTEGILRGSRKIAERADDEEGLADMGTTVVAVVVDGLRLAVAHVGDSRAVLFRDGCAGRLTSDHLAIVECGVEDESGEIVLVPENRAKGHPESNVLSRSVGGGEPLEPGDIALGANRLRPGDALLLCSDGVTEYVPEDFVARLLGRGGDAGPIAQAIVEHAVAQGSHDHSTALVALVGSGLED